jgi:alkylhydroperoxidase family enzyme
MALRASSPQADLREAVWGDTDADTGVELSRELRAFAQAAIGRDDNALDDARSALLTLIKPEGVVDAAGVVAFFNAVDRIADATGTFLDPVMQAASDMILEGLGLEKLKAE